MRFVICTVLGVAGQGESWPSWFTQLSQCHSLAGAAGTGTHIQSGNLPPAPLSGALWSQWVQMTVSAPPLDPSGLDWVTTAAS